VRDLFLGFVRLHLLYHAAKEPIYGLEMIRELGRHGYHLSPGTLYPIFHGLEGRGYLRSMRTSSHGKVRKSYVITSLASRRWSKASGGLRNCSRN
jgi:DNA-binding PadR family transcriptional regulator